MSVAIEAAASAEVLRRGYVAGMPQTCHHGLSEAWLLKECGDAHWQALGRAGARPADAYAAFTAVRVAGAELDRIGEHDRYEIASACGPAGRAQQFGVHELRAGGALRGRVEMLSTYVRRARDGDNRGIVRAAVPAQPAAPELAERAQALAERSRALRAGGWEPRHGLSAAHRRPAREFRFRPCPNNDYNGARLLYFASYAAIVDRAEWEWFGADARYAVADRELAYYGNLDLGGTLSVVLRDARVEGGGLAHWCEVRDAADGRRLADVVTRKRRAG